MCPDAFKQQLRKLVSLERTQGENAKGRAGGGG
jgi:hypothetical protein